MAGLWGFPYVPRGMASTDDRIDALYCLALDEFIAERGALARALKAEGRAEDASAVAKLPKPAVAAWAVNQVVRSRPKETRALWKAGDAVRRVQDRAVKGFGGGVVVDGHEVQPILFRMHPQGKPRDRAVRRAAR